MPPRASDARQPQVGVCILRVEKQEEYMLITITVHRHIGGTLTFAQPGHTSQHANPIEALRSAERFLESFQ